MAKLLTGTRIYGTGTVDTQLFVSGSNTATSTITGALQIVGGAGIGGNLYVGGTVHGTVNSATNLAGGVNGSIVYQSNTATTAYLAPSTAGYLLQTNGAGNAPTWVAATGVSAGSANTATNADNIRTVTRSTAAEHYLTFVDSDNGTNAYELLYTDGGITYNPSTDTLTLTGDLNVNGGDINTTAVTVTLFNTNATTVSAFGAGTAITIGATTGATTIRNATTVTSTTTATSTATGAFQVRGGAGIGGNLYVGGNTVLTGNLTVQGTTVIVDSTVTNVSDPIFIIGSGPNGANPTADDNKDRGIQFKWHNGTTAKDGFFGYDDSSGFFTFVPDATFASEVVSGTKGALDANLAGGSAMALVYQSAANTTAYLTAGSAGQILQTNGTGSAPTWVAVSGLSAGSASQVNTIAANTSANYFLTFVDSNNASAAAETVYTTSTFVVNPNTQFVGIGTGSPVATLTVGGGTQITGITTITNSTNANSTATGALVVSGGGIGVNGNSYIGGNEFVLGDLEIRGGDLLANVATTFNLINTTATTVNFAGAATSLIMGASASGSTTIRNDTTITSTTAASSTVTGSLQVRGGAGIGGNLYVGGTVHGTVNSATNLSAGSPMAIVYQSNTATTAYLTAGSAGQILQTNGTGSAPTWINVSAISAGTSSQVTTVQQPASATYFPVFVDSNNATATAEALYTTSTFVINPNTQRVGIGTSTPAETLQVKGNAIIGNNDSNFGAILQLRGYANSFKNWQIDVGLTGGNFNITPSTTDGGTTFTTPALSIDTNSNVGIGVTAPTAKLHVVGGTRITGITTVSNTTAATSTITGALQVAGGAGVGGDIYAGGDVYSRGTKVVPLNIQEFTATGGQTTFTISGGYTVGTVQVTANGVALGSGAFVASNGTTVVVNTARVAGDIIRVVSGGTSSAANNIQSYSIAMSIALGA
jgi:hypothetical protein